MAHFPIVNVAGPYLPDTATVDFTEIDALFEAAAVGTHTFAVSERRVLLLVRNPSVSGTVALGVTGAVDPFGRSGEAESSLAPGEISARFFLPTGWESSVGNRTVPFEISTTAAEVLVIGL
jgi:hypothetical protein